MHESHIERLRTTKYAELETTANLRISQFGNVECWCQHPQSELIFLLQKESQNLIGQTKIIHTR